MKVSVVIPVQDEEKTIASVLTEVKKINPFEIIIVLNGSRDRTEQIAEEFGCTILLYNEALGNDIGRAIGAKQATGDIVLFLDGDIVVPTEKLISFIEAIRTGYDIALNDLSLLAKNRLCPHYTTVSKIAVNQFLQRSDLSLNSLIAIPHAIKRDAIDKIGWHNLSDPVLAQAIAVERGLRICSPVYVNVINTNRIRPVHKTIDPHTNFPLTTSRIIGDHMRAIAFITSKYGMRAKFPTNNTNNGYQIIHSHPTKNREVKSSAIIMMPTINNGILQLLREVKIADINEVILISEFGQELEIKELTKVCNKIIQFPMYHSNAARLIGLKHSTGDICLFLDGSQIIEAKDIKIFLQKTQKNMGIVLSNKKYLLDSYNPSDFISIGQYFINMAVLRPDLFNNSLYYEPYAFHRNILDKIGMESISNPALMLSKAILSGVDVKVELQNKKMNSKQITNQESLLTESILGDQVEAMKYLLEVTDERGGFTDGGRRRDFL